MEFTKKISYIWIDEIGCNETWLLKLHNILTFLLWRLVFFLEIHDILIKLLILHIIVG